MTICKDMTKESQNNREKKYIEFRSQQWHTKSDIPVLVIIGRCGVGKYWFMKDILEDAIKKNQKIILAHWGEFKIEYPELNLDYEEISFKDSNNQLNSLDIKHKFLRSDNDAGINYRSMLDYFINFDNILLQNNEAGVLLIDEASEVLEKYMIEYLSKNNFSALKVVITLDERNSKNLPKQLAVIDLYSLWK